MVWVNKCVGRTCSHLWKVIDTKDLLRFETLQAWVVRKIFFSSFSFFSLILSLYIFLFLTSYTRLFFSPSTWKLLQNIKRRDQNRNFLKVTILLLLLSSFHGRLHFALLLIFLLFITYVLSLCYPFFYSLFAGLSR